MDLHPGKRIRLKIESDGTPHGTMVKTLDGDMLEGVQDIQIHMDSRSLATVTMTFVDIPFLIEAEFIANSMQTTKVFPDD